jgi:hypothetical protein
VSAVKVCRKHERDKIPARKLAKNRGYASRYAGTVSVPAVQNHSLMGGDWFSLPVGFYVINE